MRIFDLYTYIRKPNKQLTMELIAFTIKIDWLQKINHGWGNGYVAVPENHVTYGLDYNTLECISIHGGLTFSSNYQDWMPESVKGMWVFGFDCAHYNDTQESCPKEYVEAESQNLLEQLNKVVKSIKLVEEVNYTIPN